MRKKISDAIKKKLREDPIYREKRRANSKERMRDPEIRKQHVKWLHDGLKKKRQDKEYQRKFSKTMTQVMQRRINNPEFIQKMKKAMEFQKKKIPDVKKFLEEIQAGKESRELVKEYKMSCPTLNKRISEILGVFNVKNYKSASKFLKNIDIDTLLR